MTKTLMSAASAIAILLGSSAVYAQATQDQQTGADQPELGAQQDQQQLGTEQPGMGMQQQEIRATVESKDEDNREIVLRLATGEQVDFDDFEEGDEVYVSFEDDEHVGRIGREPGAEWETEEQQQ